jgi:hypothetical protein
MEGGMKNTTEPCYFTFESSFIHKIEKFSTVQTLYVAGITGGEQPVTTRHLAYAVTALRHYSPMPEE